MSKAEIERFVTDVRADPNLQAAFEGKSLDGPTLVAVARERGFDFTTEQVEAHVRAKSQELSEQELESAAGGSVLLLSIDFSNLAKVATSTSGGGSTTTGGTGNPPLLSGVVGIGLF